MPRKAKLGTPREYLGEFTDTVDSIFSYDDVMGALDDIPPLFGSTAGEDYVVLTDSVSPLILEAS
jgi:hypothetical protein